MTPASDSDFFGWTVVTDTAPKGVSAAFAALVDRPGVVALYRGDPDDSATPRVIMSGTTGGDGPDANEPLDPDILLDLAKREAVMESLRLDGFDLSGTTDLAIGRAINHLRATGRDGEADHLGRSRAAQLARTTVRAMTEAAANEGKAG